MFLTNELKNKIREELAELEHEQWWDWSTDINMREPISEEREERWKRLWRPYKELNEEQKEQDRVWADKVIKIFDSLQAETHETKDGWCCACSYDEIRPADEKQKKLASERFSGTKNPKAKVGR